MSTPKISVIMLTYNREELVGRAIESILNQTMRDFEYIIVNNGSSDRSGAIADEYALKDDRIRVIHRERGNIGSGRNTGLDTARGDYIAFIDDDDWVEPDFLEFLYGLTACNNAEFAICGAADKAFDERRVMTAEVAVIELLWRRCFNVAFPTKLIARRLFENNRFPNTGKFDDIALMPIIMAGANKVVYHGLPKYTFERHEANNSSWTTNHRLITPNILDEYLAVYRERTEWLCRLFPSSAAAWRYFEWSFMISMVEKVKRLELHDCAAQLKYMTVELNKHQVEFYNSELLFDFEKEWMERYIMNERLCLGKLTLIIITRCNLRCKLCCEYVPQNNPFSDMLLDECHAILSGLFRVVDRVTTLHLSGGGEPFLHPKLPELIEACMEYADRFDRLMLFTNCTVIPSSKLLDTLKKYRDKLFVQVSRYGVNPVQETEALSALHSSSVTLKVEKYYGEDQSFGGWVDFGPWKAYGRTEEELDHVYANCAVTRDMRGNWRTRNGKVHWCSRSQRGMELGLMPNCTQDFVDLLDTSTGTEEKREKFSQIIRSRHLSACEYCSGDQGTTDASKRHPAAEQL